MNRKINWLGLSAGVVTLVMLVVSYFTPWWQLTIGQNLIKIGASPVNTSFGLFGSQFTIPIIWALNIVTILTFAASGIVMLIYSLLPTKPYARDLIGFSWKKPIYSVIGFAVGLIIVLVAAGHFGLYLPINGSSTVTLPSNWTQGATVTAQVSGTFQISFWLAVIATGLCILAKVFHGRFQQPQAATATAQSTSPTAPNPTVTMAEQSS
jgi:hypothetical protein